MSEEAQLSSTVHLRHSLDFRSSNVVDIITSKLHSFCIIIMYMHMRMYVYCVLRIACAPQGSGDKIGTLMRHHDTSCGPMSCVPPRKNGIPEFVFKPLYWRADTIGEITSVVVSLIVVSHPFSLVR